MVLNEKIGVESKIINVSSGIELPDQVPDLIEHFENVGSPIMIGGGVLAHTIVGVAYDEVTRDCQFLILDPHYTGTHNETSIKEEFHSQLTNLSSIFNTLIFWNSKREKVCTGRDPSSGKEILIIIFVYPNCRHFSSSSCAINVQCLNLIHRTL